MNSKNVLLIVADQWRGDGIHALGASHVVTPTLDALAAEGIAFTSHYGQATPCAPSRASPLHRQVPDEPPGRQ